MRNVVLQGAGIAEEGFLYSGSVYFLLRGGVNVMGNGGQKVVDTYRPVVQFVDCGYALQVRAPRNVDFLY